MTRKPLYLTAFRRRCSPCPPRPPRRRSRRRPRVAYMVDLSSGAVLYAKDPDRRMPPASMAKMMTTHVAFDLIQRGEFEPRQDLHGAPGDLAALARRRGGLDHVPARRRAGQRAQSAARHRHRLGQRRRGDARRVHFRAPKPAFVALMNRQSRETGPRQFALGQSGRLARRRRHLHHRARPRHARRRHDPRLSGALPRILSGARAHLGRARSAPTSRSPSPTAIRCSAASPAPTASRPAIPRRRATASPARPSATGAASSW